jgi:hypothetical protein
VPCRASADDDLAGNQAAGAAPAATCGSFSRSTGVEQRALLGSRQRASDLVLERGLASTYLRVAQRAPTRGQARHAAPAVARVGMARHPAFALQSRPASGHARSGPPAPAADNRPVPQPDLHRLPTRCRRGGG